MASSDSESDSTPPPSVVSTSVPPSSFPSTTEMKGKLSGAGTAEDPYTYTDEFGIVYQWDKEKSLWASKENLDSLMAKQQEAYNALNNSKADDKKKRKKDKKKKKKKKNSGVYITGLPEDITETELVSFMSKCGVPKKDSQDPTKIKCKLYKDDQGKGKGDGLFVYFKPESVNLAMNILDGAEIRPGYPVKLQEPTYEQKQQDPNKPKQRSKKLKVYNQKKELGWEDDDHTHVVLKHMFDLKEAETDPSFFEELKVDIQTECEKFGTVEKIKIFERHPDGVVIVIFEDPRAAQMCIDKLSGRWFGGQQVEAEFYDGWKNYKAEEIVDEEEEKKRLDAFGDWLEKD